MPATIAPALEVRGLTKSFGPTVALSDVSMTLQRGSIHALIGLNGSGKSTLVKVLCGYHSADDGVFKTGGEVVFVHQDLGLFPSLTVLENFAIGRPMAMKRGKIDWSSERARARGALAEFELGETVDKQIASLTQAERAVIAIARAIDRAQGIDVAALVLDEPTSALPNHEISLLARAMRRFADRGIGIVFITHRLQEVVDLCESVTVLRNGKVVFDGAVTELGVHGMVEQMVGNADLISEKHTWVPPTRSEQPVLKAVGIHSRAIKSLDLSIYGGEILGIFGMAGSGILTIGEFLSGRSSPAGGHVEYQGKKIGPKSPDMRAVAYVPSDRPRRGVLPGLTVRENISIRCLGSTLRAGQISKRTEKGLASQWTRNLRIKPDDPEAPILSLSGGNQQKVILGRWLATGPSAIVAEEPTQGIDVWAKAEILRQLRGIAETGTAVVLTAVEPEEILDFCDRIIVLRNGEINLDTTRASVTVNDILRAMHQD